MDKIPPHRTVWVAKVADDNYLVTEGEYGRVIVAYETEADADKMLPILMEGNGCGINIEVMTWANLMALGCRLGHTGSSLFKAAEGEKE